MFYTRWSDLCSETRKALRRFPNATVIVSREQDGRIRAVTILEGERMTEDGYTLTRNLVRRTIDVAKHAEAIGIWPDDVRKGLIEVACEYLPRPLYTHD